VFLRRLKAALFAEKSSDATHARHKATGCWIKSLPAVLVLNGEFALTDSNRHPLDLFVSALHLALSKKARKEAQNRNRLHKKVE
jgi:hypothetical protein